MFRLAVFVFTPTHCIRGDGYELLEFRSDCTFPTIKEATLWYQEQIEMGEISVSRPPSQHTLRFVPTGYHFNDGVVSPDKYHHNRYKDVYGEDRDSLMRSIGAMQLTEPRNMRFRWFLYKHCYEYQLDVNHFKLKEASPFFETLEECLCNLSSIRKGELQTLVEACYAP